ncbi:MAG: hypothetical protein JW836_13265 [Deltaproteobacteria bacterium]|nr:hypothetical protein [Deltaproteobacteria bacterium]
MRDFTRIKREIQHLVSQFGAERVFWPRDLSWVMIKNWSLPDGMNRKASNVIVLIPDHYGNGATLRDAFIDPDLKALEPSTGQYLEIPHYYIKYPYASLSLGTGEEWQAKNWRYICLHEKSGDSNLLSYLIHLYKFLSDPFRNWSQTFASYRRGS